MYVCMYVYIYIYIHIHTTGEALLDTGVSHVPTLARLRDSAGIHSFTSRATDGTWALGPNFPQDLLVLDSLVPPTNIMHRNTRRMHMQLSWRTATRANAEMFWKA